MNFGYRSTFQLMDKGNVELFGPLGITYNFSSFSKVLSVLQSGFVYHYSFVTVGALIGLVSFFLLTHFELSGFYGNTPILLFFSYFVLSISLTTPK
jgi:hypothetical protein